MAQVDTLEGLLETALQDLLRGEGEKAKRLGPLIVAASDELAALLERDALESVGQRDKLAAIVARLGFNTDGPENLWTAGVLDDADRDSETIAPGPLLDIALIGAIRKGKQAEAVSYETAILLANAFADAETANDLEAIQREECVLDRELKQLQAQIVIGIAR